MPKCVCAPAGKPLEWTAQRVDSAMAPQGVQDIAGCDT